jgi:hypothetical protein
MATPARVVGAELLLDGGGRRPMSLEEFEALKLARNQDVLENVLVTYDDGLQIRPYRFGSVAPIELQGGTIIL